MYSSANQPSAFAAGFDSPFGKGSLLVNFRLCRTPEVLSPSVEDDQMKFEEAKCGAAFAFTEVGCPAPSAGRGGSAGGFQLLACGPLSGPGTYAWFDTQLCTLTGCSNGCIGWRHDGGYFRNTVRLSNGGQAAGRRVMTRTRRLNALAIAASASTQYRSLFLAAPPDKSSPARVNLHLERQADHRISVSRSHLRDATRLTIKRP